MTTTYGAKGERERKRNSITLSLGGRCKRVENKQTKTDVRTTYAINQPPTPYPFIPSRHKDTAPLYDAVIYSKLSQIYNVYKVNKNLSLSKNKKKGNTYPLN